MAQNLSDDLILAGALVEENLRAGVAKRMRVDLKARESKNRSLDLRSKTLW
jgi:hypothetical protein